MTFLPTITFSHRLLGLLPIVDLDTINPQLLAILHLDITSLWPSTMQLSLLSPSTSIQIDMHALSIPTSLINSKTCNPVNM